MEEDDGSLSNWRETLEDEKRDFLTFKTNPDRQQTTPTLTLIEQKTTFWYNCYGPQPYARFASICQSIRVCVSSIPVLFEPATFVYLFS
jgi:hypothetical protein